MISWRDDETLINLRLDILAKANINNIREIVDGDVVPD
jgi:hypothetical protein